jgi:uncharacterized membrane protein SirB2
MSVFHGVLYLHIAAVVISVLFMVVRFFWICRQSPKLQEKWVRISPHVTDTVLLLTGIILTIAGQCYPFTEAGNWLTEKLFGVIIYILLGFIALSKRRRAPAIRWIAFLLGMGCITWVIDVAIIKVPLVLG